MATQETVKQITQGGVTRDVEDTTARQGLASKVDKNGTDSLMTAAEHTKLEGIAAGAQVNVINSISVNGTPQSPVNGNVDIEVEGAAGEDGITPHIGSNGNWWIGPETDPTNDTNIKAQGPMGSVTITDGDIDTLEVHNALNAYTGLLGMSGAMKLKSNIDAVQANLVKLYNKLANMAFWDSQDQEDAEPTALDWSIPKVTLAITNNLAHSVVKHNGSTVSGSIQVDQGETVSLVVTSNEAAYGISSVSADSGTVINNGDGTFTVDVVVNANTVLTITGTYVSMNMITYTLTGLNANDQPQSVFPNGGATITLAANTNYDLPFAVQVSGATLESYSRATGEVVIVCNSTGAVTITAKGIYKGYTLFPTKLANSFGYLNKGNNIRATVLVDNTHLESSEQTVWNTQHIASENIPYVDFDLMQTESLIPIPSGASSVAIALSNSAYAIANIVWESGEAESGTEAASQSWQNQAETIDLTQFTSPVYLGINVKRVDGGNFNGNETVSTIGLSVTFS